MYNGYSVKIGNTTIPSNLIAKGSYNFKKEKRVIRTWKDANGEDHEDLYDKRKVVIEFSIIERGLAEQETIGQIFENTEDLTVQYWDDFLCQYKQGKFDMEVSGCARRSSYGGSIQYAATKIKLEEH